MKTRDWIIRASCRLAAITVAGIAMSGSWLFAQAAPAQAQMAVPSTGILNLGRVSQPATVAPALQTAPAAAAQPLPTSPTDVFSVRTFGATGDGVTDDTAALQAAADAAAGRVLIIDPGIYLTSGLVIDGPTRVVATGATLKGGSGSLPMLDIRRSTVVDGIALDGNGTARIGINIVNTSGVTVSRCTATNIKGSPAAVRLSSATDFRIAGCTIRGSSMDAIGIYYSSDGRIEDNDIADSGRHGIEWWGGDAKEPANPIRVRDVAITGNKVRDSNGGGGIWGSLGERILVAGNTVEGCFDVCIDPEAGTGTVVRDNFVRNGRNGGITVFMAATNTEIAHNTVIQEPGYDFGIKIYGIGTSRGINIHHNDITTHGTHGMTTLKDVLSDSSVTNNTFTLRGAGKPVNIVGGENNVVTDNVVR